MSRGGHIRVYDGRKVQELLSGGSSPVPRFARSSASPTRSAAFNTGEDGMLTARSRARSVRMQAQRERAKRATRHELYLREQVQAQKQAQAKVRERIQANRRKADAKFEATYRDLIAGKALTDQVDKLLELQDTADRQKKEQMFAEWEEKVFNPITKSITRQIDEVGHDTLSRLRREEYDKFLKATNGKQGLFLDIVLENDYDPFVPNSRRIKSDCGKLHDPVKRVLSKTEEEKGMVDTSTLEKPKKPGRETLDVKQWHTGKIEATPHGHFAMMMAEPAGGVTEKAAKLTRSAVTFDHFHVAVGNDVVRSEFPRGKRPASTIRRMVADSNATASTTASSHK